jgi:hypothetical protein
MAHDVFICHSAKDKTTANAVCAMLEGEGIRCWIAPRDVLASIEWGEEIIGAIEECRIMVLVFTANANASPHVRREIERAANHGVAILPLRVEDVLPGKALEFFIGNVHWLDALTPPFAAHLKNLAGTIKILLARMEPRDAQPMRPAIARKVPEVARPLEPATVTPVPQPEEEYSNGGEDAGERVSEDGGWGLGALAQREFMGVEAWLWAAVLLIAVFATVHFTSRSHLQETMKTLQSELGSIGTVSFTDTIQNKADGSALQGQFSGQFSSVVADPALCRVSYHWENALDGQDQALWFLLHDVTIVVVEPASQFETEINAAGGVPNRVVTSTSPPVTVLVARRLGGSDMFPFTDAALADRTAATLTQAVKLCGGHLAN